MLNEDIAAKQQFFDGIKPSQVDRTPLHALTYAILDAHRVYALFTEGALICCKRSVDSAF
jgi:hypothetical protein